MRTLFRSVTMLVFTIILAGWVSPSEAGNSCTSPCPKHGDTFSWQGFTVLNNQWGQQLTNSAKKGWYQRIVDGKTTVSFEYNWWGGKPDQVMGHPAIIAGWHYGDAKTGGNWTPNSFGLPAKISDEKAFNSGFTASHANTNNGYEKMNLSWDIWIAWSADPGKSGAPGNEIMVWAWRDPRKNQQPLTNDQPGGPKGGRVDKSITLPSWSGKWDLYSGWNPMGWWVFTFVRQENTTDTKGDLRDFINYMWKTKEWLRGDQWIVGIEFGSEIMQGQGSWKISRYWLTP